MPLLSMHNDFNLPDYLRVQTRDLRAFTKAFGEAWRPYNEFDGTPDGDFRLSMQIAQLSQLALARFELYGGLSMNGGALQDIYAIALPLEGRLIFENQEHKTEVTGKTGCVNSAGIRHKILVPSGVNLFNVRIQRQALENELESILGRKIHSPIQFEPELDLGGSFGQQILRLAKYLVAEVNALYPSPLEDSLVLQHVERTLLALLLEQQPHNYSAEMRLPSTSSVPWQVIRAEEYVRSNVELPLRVDDVARAVGVTTRTLSGAFNRHREYTPVQFIRKMKLAAVNKLLRSTNMGDSVTEIAARYGFSHTGHFAANYCLQFGEPPSQTLKSSLSEVKGN